MITLQEFQYTTILQHWLGVQEHNFNIQGNKVKGNLHNRTATKTITKTDDPDRERMSDKCGPG
jgi:hypothetical protein